MKIERPRNCYKNSMVCKSDHIHKCYAAYNLYPIFNCVSFAAIVDSFAALTEYLEYCLTRNR